MHLDFSENAEAQDLINLVNFSDNHVFLTGRAGTGKTSLIRSVLSQIQKRFIALASTGIAAINISGKTIHSFFHFDIVPILPGDPLNYNYNQEKRQLISNLQMIIIDEVSMVRADTIDAVDRTLRFYRKSSQPFGGIQLVLVGDSFQLPPIAQTSHWNVLKETYQSLFFFDALVFRNCELLTIELIKVYRQQDPFFLNILDAIRLNKPNPDLLSELNKRVISSTEVAGMVTLATTKDIVAYINNEKLAALPGKSKQYKGAIEGIFDSLPNLQSLELKKGAQIMMVKNDNQNRWVNGSTGIVTDLHEQQVSIKLNTGAEHLIDKETWYNLEFKYDSKQKTVTSYEVGRFSQLPLTLCWAMTIHKSQGLTFDNVTIDLGRGAWDSGQTYVALSRCTSIHGLFLKQPVRKNDIILDHSVVEFSNNFNNEVVYESSYKAKMTNKTNVLNNINIAKQEVDYSKIIYYLKILEKLPNNLIETYYNLALKTYCTIRVGESYEAQELLIEMSKYEAIKKIIGRLNYDSILSILNAADMLNSEKDAKRGLAKIQMILSTNTPETIAVLQTIVFDHQSIQN